MSEFIDITGNKYNMLTVLELRRNANGVNMWLCKCDCGNETFVRASNLKSGAVKSCGCLRKPKPKHGMSNSKLYRVWNGMKNRCYCKTVKSYKDYGARGIDVCDEWRNSPEAFISWALKNGYSDGMTIERIDNEKGYSPDNCKWISKGEQTKNRRNCRLYTYNGKTQVLSEWCKELNVDYKMTHNRINKLHWTFEKAIETPCFVDKRNRRKK